MEKYRYTETDKFAHRHYMRRNNIKQYNPITLLKKVVGWGLIGYSIITLWLPSGSQLTLLLGCSILGIPFSKVLGKFKLYLGKIWFIICVLCSKKRLKYELRRVFL